MNDHDDRDPLTPDEAEISSGEQQESSPVVDQAAATDAEVEATGAASPEPTLETASPTAVEGIVSAAAQADSDLAGADENAPEANLPVSGGWVEYAPIDPDQANIDAALAAVASLGALNELEREESLDERPYTPPIEDQLDAEVSVTEADAARDSDFVSEEPEHQPDRQPSRSTNRTRTTRTAASRAAAATLTTSMAVPPISGLRRGSPGSVIPALALIAMGAWLTFTTTTGSAVDPLLLVGMGVGIVVLSLFAYWISTGRWSRGALFAAALIALLAAIGIASMPIPALNLRTSLNLTQAYPLILSAVGIAMLIGGGLARPRSRAAFAPGLVLLTAGIVGVLVTLGVVPSSILDLAVRLWFVPVVVLVIVWLLPLVFRLRDRD